MIYAATKDRVIGNSKTNSMPWPKIKKDMLFFKEKTFGSAVIMGRKTFESLGKALPGRQNIVITRQKDAVFDNCDSVSSLDEALSVVNCDNAFVIGGAQIYQQAMPLVDKIYCTLIKNDFEGDVKISELPGMWLSNILYEDDQILIEELDRVY